MNHYLITRIEDIADWASENSGTSYEDYIKLFTFKVDKTFKNHSKRNTAIFIAVKYGYVPNKERKFEFG
ncbi:hypothetical protein GLP30_18890 [Photobacterium phosphoreum]|uniref:Uncharacterized protein n=1 Tax=Photobacterium phosphoreum TaxID=659 RepID=A0AAW4ZXG4_PHOPO|nr:MULTISPECIES: hypothetical protein [Photobacterium]MCD9465116.1 hypothetical protein [Photobacterium phosphoreum]MCD9472663.1 hypothetical protein [Photobacterium phosphoreum]MCD9481103.1 hypothetical protein [Photobacterium phosphoreum]MCD9485486.1 hypothetical protein [Photobacterium phosphoreum]MCD9492910.1 hypothetical protein [Photobacterium phosphoreum]